MLNRFRDFLRSAAGCLAAIGWWLLVVGLIVLGSVIEHLVIVF